MTDRIWIEPKRPVVPRAPGRNVAKDTKPTVQAIVVDGDRLVVTHHEGRGMSRGGVTIRDADGKLLRKVAGSSGPIVKLGDGWLANGPYKDGAPASANVLDADLKELARLPVCAPFAALSATTFVACAVTDPGGLVEVDWQTKRATPVVAALPLDELTHATLSPDRGVLYAASRAGRVLAVRLSDRTVLWDRPPLTNAIHWSGYALALDAAGRHLAVGSAASSGADLRIFDTRTGEVESHAALLRMLDAARVATKRNVRIQALAYHPTGWLAAATNAGVVAELHPTGEISAFRAATRGIDALAFTPDGASLIVGGAEPLLRVWPVEQVASRR